MGSTWSQMITVVFILVLIPAATAQAPEEGYSREQLLPLTKFRQQHQRTIDGRLCAAAFVQNRKAYTGCTDAPNPSGVSGRPWCYVEPQLLGDAPAWNYCGSVVNYDAVRDESKRGIPQKIASIRTYVGKLQKAQRAAEKALDMFHKRCAA